MPPIPVNTPNGLRQLRRLLGVSQQGLAERIGVHPDTVKKWEQGKYRVSIDGIQRCQRIIRQWRLEHEGDRRSAVVGAAQSPIPSLDELFS